MSVGRAHPGPERRGSAKPHIRASEAALPGVQKWSPESSVCERDTAGWCGGGSWWEVTVEVTAGSTASGVPWAVLGTFCHVAIVGGFTVNRTEEAPELTPPPPHGRWTAHK